MRCRGRRPVSQTAPRTCRRGRNPRRRRWARVERTATRSSRRAAREPRTPASRVPSTRRACAQDDANLPDGVHPARKEQYLTDAEFHRVLGASRGAFAEYKPWKQQALKKAAGLF